ncbi:MAG: transcriptional repressor [Candidatus Omnitrophica bacterium]|nr:transcriptional repressor [Candidatus Omnitrophota bacterium]
MADAISVFRAFLKKKGLKLTRQREIILKAFIGTEKHVTTDDLYEIVKKKKQSIGHATVFRTLKLMCESDLATSLNLDGKVTRFEHKYGHEQHYHLVCTKCGKFIEAVDPEIERLQQALAKRFSFKVTSHKLRILGLCKECSRKKRR